MRALIFPGQGKSVCVGMGKDIAENYLEAKEVFQEVDEALQQNLFRLMCDGSQEELTLTENAQPALMSVGIAIIRVIEKQGGIDLKEFCKYFAGHSLGEYTALTAARSLKLSDAAIALRYRGKFMQNAVKAGQGAMAALLGATTEIASELCHEVQNIGVCEISNDNAVGQIVISGASEAVSKAVELAKQKNIKRAIMLPVSAPFHCALMQPAADNMQDILEDIEIVKPIQPIISNVTAKPEDDPEIIKKLLIQGITHTVRWRESVEMMVGEDIEKFVEFGPQKVLAGLVKKIAPNSDISSLHVAEDIGQFFNDSGLTFV